MKMDFRALTLLAALTVSTSAFATDYGTNLSGPNGEVSSGNTYRDPASAKKKHKKKKKKHKHKAASEQ